MSGTPEHRLSGHLLASRLRFACFTYKVNSCKENVLNADLSITFKFHLFPIFPISTLYNLFVLPPLVFFLNYPYFPLLLFLYFFSTRSLLISLSLFTPSIIRYPSLSQPIRSVTHLFLSPFVPLSTKFIVANYLTNGLPISHPRQPLAPFRNLSVTPCQSANHCAS